MSKNLQKRVRAYEGNTDWYSMRERGSARAMLVRLKSESSILHDKGSKLLRVKANPDGGKRDVDSKQASAIRARAGSGRGGNPYHDEKGRFTHK